MPERSVAKVMTQRYRLYEILVEVEHTPDVPAYARHYLYMQYTPGYIVVFVKADHLRLIV
jgi:hypothetical protein